MKFTDDELLALLKEGHSNRECARRLSVDESSTRARAKKLAKKGWSPEHNWTTTVPDGYKIKGISQYVDEEGKVLRQWVKSDVDKERQHEMMKAVLDAFKEELPQYAPVKYRQTKDIDTDKIAVFPIGDLHVGMLSWKDETGNDWDVRYTEAAIYHALSRAVDAAPKCQKAVIIDLGDFFHTDNMEGVTTKSGHHLDTDTRFAKMIQVGVKIYRIMISLALAKFPEVEVKVVSGNHNQTASLTLQICLKHIYENEPRITIDDAPTPVHYVEFGKVLIATTHGDTIKMENLSRVVANDQAEMWGRTKHRYALTGHIHSTNKKEFPGMVVESFRTLAAADSYACWYGWRSGRDTQAIVYHKDHGEIERYTINISMVDDILKVIDNGNQTNK